ncbi:MAG TPA: hypothetical protein VFS94_01455 [Gemmatimonadales bacterium]|nr:hypothetical protein [Gemmatimonadales bacterium]
MAPSGITIDLLPPAGGARLRALLPEAQTAVRFLSGKCSCDFFLQRDPVAHREESELRRRWRKLGMNRQAILAATDRHRRAPALNREPEAWQQSIAAFVAEHLRNAGPTLYLHQFSGDGHVHPAADATEIELEKVRHNPVSWLPEGTPVIVVRDRAT